MVTYTQDKERNGKAVWYKDMSIKRVTDCKELRALVVETGEELILWNGEEFQNFNRLRELLGKDYDNVNDDLMDGITEWGGSEWTHTQYENGEAVQTIKFTFTE